MLRLNFLLLALGFFIASFQLHAQDLPSVNPSLFVAPRGAQACDVNMVQVAVRGMQLGLRCFQNHQFSERLSEFSDLIRRAAEPHQQIVLDCRDPDHMGYRAYAHQDETPQRVEFSQRMATEVEAGTNTTTNDVTVFHELMHLLNADYHHGYVRQMADITVACEICCAEGLGVQTSYLRGEDLTDADRVEQCNYCRDPHITSLDADLTYRQKMFNLAQDKNKPMMLENLMEALQGHSHEQQMAVLTPEVRQEFCNSDAESRQGIVKGLEAGLGADLQSACHSDK